MFNFPISLQKDPHQLFVRQFHEILKKAGGGTKLRTIQRVPELQYPTIKMENDNLAVLSCLFTCIAKRYIQKKANFLELEA
tara:strand:- start:9672 stop:9914 length:243 start_codon:yes stop_codon:yes gene_type:complete